MVSSGNMPTRSEPFVNDEMYHIYNKTIDGIKVFQEDSICLLFLKLITYYRSLFQKTSYSLFIHKSELIRNEEFKLLLQPTGFMVDLYCYCLMPNHFHLLVRQKVNNGVVKFMSNLLNSLTRHYNKLAERTGPLFIPNFRSRRIDNEEQLLHVSRYIHLNPYTSKLVKSYDELFSYSWSSLKDYCSENVLTIVNKKVILKYFKNDKDRYIKFVVDNAEYQRKLQIDRRDS